MLPWLFHHNEKVLENMFYELFRDINITDIGQVTSLIKIKTDSVICTRLFEQVCHLLVFSSEQ